LAIVGVITWTLTRPRWDPPERPNFLFLAVDDLNAIVGFLGEQPGSPLRTIYPDAARRAEVRKRLTPNLDRLAASGRAFHRAYCPAPLCGPSRTAILTGVPAHTSGYHLHRQNFRECPPLAAAVTLPQWLRQHGWFTAGVGKIFHRSKPEPQGDGRVADWTDRELSWDAFPYRYEGGPPHKQDVTSKYNAPDTYIRYGITHTPVAQMHDYQNACFIAELLTKGTASLQTVDKQMAAVTLPEDRPFFLACGLFAPHFPWCVPAEYFARFPTEEMAIDESTLRSWRSDTDDLPRFGLDITAVPDDSRNELQSFLKRALAADGPAALVPLMRELNQAYLATLAFADTCLGVMLDGLDASPRAKDTIVVLWGDNAFHLGEKARLGKMALWDEATHTVLVLRVPGQPEPGVGVTTPVSLQGIFKTITDCAGLSTPPQVQGTSLLPWITDPRRSGPPVLTSMGFGLHAVRDERWCYIRYRADQQELYDDQADPDQLRNLAGSPEHANVIARLAALLPTNEAPLFERR